MYLRSWYPPTKNHPAQTAILTTLSAIIRASVISAQMQAGAETAAAAEAVQVVKGVPANGDIIWVKDTDHV